MGRKYASEKGTPHPVRNFLISHHVEGDCSQAFQAFVSELCCTGLFSWEPCDGSRGEYLWVVTGNREKGTRTPCQAGTNGKEF